MSDNEDFEEQIRLEQQAVTTAAKLKIKTDDDGTEYEWDEVKKAWFPRIDADFIAQYQLNYGSNDTNPDTKPEIQQDYLTYDDFVKLYYGSYREAFDLESHLKSGKHDSEVKTQSGQDTKAKCLMKEDGSVIENGDARSKYDDYCSEYYKAWESGNYDYFRKHYNYEEDEDEEGGDDSKKKKKKASGKRKKDEGWFSAEEGANNNVYVSGLPPDITIEEFSDFMGKAGMIMFDPSNRKPKVKLYKTESGENKGDGRCCYIKAESIDLALRFLDKSELRGHEVHVEKAQFTMRGEYDSKKRKKVSNKQKNKLKVQQEKLFDWRPDKDRFSRPKNERTVVLKKMFQVGEFDEDPALVNEIRDDLKAECSKLGEVKKVVVYDRNPEGVATVTFAEAAAADACIKFMNKRWFAKKQISAVTWDGKTKFAVEETEEERTERLKKWEEYLEKGGEDEKTVIPEPSASDVITLSTNPTPSTSGLKASESPVVGSIDSGDEPASTKFLKTLQSEVAHGEVNTVTSPKEGSVTSSNVDSVTSPNEGSELVEKGLSNDQSESKDERQLDNKMDVN